MLPWGGILSNYGKNRAIQYLNNTSGTSLGTILSILTSKDPVQAAKNAATGYAMNKGMGYVANQTGISGGMGGIKAGEGWSGFTNMLSGAAANYLMGAPQDTGEATGRSIGSALGSAFIPYIGGAIGAAVGGGLGELASGGEKQRSGSLEFSSNPITKGVLGDTNVYGRGQDVFGNFGLTDEQYFGHKWDPTYNNFAANLSASDNFVAQHLNMSPQQTQEAFQYLQNLNGQSYLLGTNRDNGLQQDPRMLVDHYASILSSINPSLGNLMQTYTGDKSGFNQALSSDMALASNYISGKATQQDINTALQQGYNNMFSQSQGDVTKAPTSIFAPGLNALTKMSNGQYAMVQNQGQGQDTARWNPQTNQVEFGHYTNSVDDGGNNNVTWVPGSINNLGNLGDYNNATLHNLGAIQNNQGANFGQYALSQWEASPQFQVWKQQQLSNPDINAQAAQQNGIPDSRFFQGK